MTVLERLRLKFPVLTPPKVKAEARVAIAKDVIETLAIKRMVASLGYGYFSAEGYARGVGESFEAMALGIRMQGKTRCKVCAIGAACVSAVGLYNDAPLLEKYYTDIVPPPSDDMRTILARWFTRKQLDLIECAYEVSSSYDEGGSSYRARDKAQVFGRQYDDDHHRERLEAIMQNVIDNKGTFRP